MPASGTCSGRLMSQGPQMHYGALAELLRTRTGRQAASAGVRVCTIVDMAICGTHALLISKSSALLDAAAQLSKAIGQPGEREHLSSGPDTCDAGVVGYGILTWSGQGSHSSPAHGPVWQSLTPLSSSQ